MAHALTPTSTPIPAIRARRVHPLPILMRGMWLQAIRRNEFYVALILGGLYALGALVMRIVGIDSAQLARFVASLGFELAAAIASLLVIVTTTRGVSEELDQRTIYPVLAKPVARWQFLAGKALSAWALGMAALLLFSTFTIAIAPHTSYQAAPVPLQALLLKAAALALLANLCLALTVDLPLGIAMLLAAAANFGASTLANGIATLAPAGTLWTRILAGLLPDFSLFSQFERYIDGGASLAASSMISLLIYAIMWSGLLGGWSIARFARKSL